MSTVLISTIVVAATGLIVGVLLGIAGEAFKVEVDEREIKVREFLPGNNCGGCGFAGCDALAKAIVLGQAPVNGCPVGGDNVAAQISKVMGVAESKSEKQVAFVKCSGTCDKAEIQYNYYGFGNCQMASVVPGKGDKKCSYGCMGLGSCVEACAFDAIHIVNGVAKVDKEKCAACKKCIAACPNGLIELVPYSKEHKVVCNSNDKGKDVKAVCEAGCIGCMLCTKVCEAGAITVTNNLAHIDYSKCTGCGKCKEKCPSKVIL